MSILLKNISKVYEKCGELINVLEDINININENEFIVFLGSLGTGKTTLIRIIGMIDEPSSGEYIFNNINIKKNSNKLNSFRNKYFGYVSKDIGLIDYIPVYKNIRIPLEYSKLSKDEIKDRINYILNKFDLFNEANTLPSQLSKEQYQKVVLARAIINDPPIILVDELLSFLDKKNRDMVIGFLCDLHKEGKTIILTTHDLKIIKHYTRVIEIEDGRIFSEYINEVEINE